MARERLISEQRYTIYDFRERKYRSLYIWWRDGRGLRSGVVHSDDVAELVVEGGGCFLGVGPEPPKVFLRLDIAVLAITGRLP